jgi:hypothetical protein
MKPGVGLVAPAAGAPEAAGRVSATAVKVRKGVSCIARRLTCGGLRVTFVRIRVKSKMMDARDLYC